MIIKEAYDLIDGKEVPQLFLYKDYTLTGIHQGTINIMAGHFTLEGRLEGTLNIQSQQPSKITGVQAGSVSLISGAKIHVTGAIEGTTTVQQGAILIIEAGGKFAGTLSNNGKVIIRGVFGGLQDGNGELVVEGPGYIKQPKIIDGNYFYDW